MGCLHNSFIHLINIYHPPTLSRLWASDVQLGWLQDLNKVKQYKKGEDGSKSFRECLIFCVYFHLWIDDRFISGLTVQKREINMWRGMVLEGSMCGNEECKELLKQGVNQLSIRMFSLLEHKWNLETSQWLIDFDMFWL